MSWFKKKDILQVFTTFAMTLENQVWRVLFLFSSSEKWRSKYMKLPYAVNSIDWTWFAKAHICLSQQTMCQGKNQTTRWKELPAGTGLGWRSGWGHENIIAAFKIPRSTVVCIYLEWKKFKTTGSLCAAQASWKIREAGWLRTWCSLCKSSSRDGESFQRDNHQLYLINSTQLGLYDPMEKQRWERTDWSFPSFAKQATEGVSGYESRLFDWKPRLNCLASVWSLTCL